MKNELEMSDIIDKIFDYIDVYEIRKNVVERLSNIAQITNPEEFKMLLDIILKYPDSAEAIKRNWKAIYSNAITNVELIPIFARNPNLRKELNLNTEFLFQKVKWGTNRAEILSRELSNLEGGEKVIAEHFETLLLTAQKDIKNIVIPALKTEEGREKVKQYFGQIKNKCTEKIDDKYDVKSFFEIIENLEELPEFEEEYRKYHFWGELYNQIRIPKYIPKSDRELLCLSREKQAEEIIKSDAEYVKEVEFANILYSKDIEEKRMILEGVAHGNKYEFRATGSSGIIIQAGDQVVKMGSQKRKFNIPYHPRIMMPYFRKEYNDTSCLEVFNYGNSRSPKITDEKLLEIYKELEKDGIIWADARKSNLIELTKDNIVPEFVRSEEFNIFGFLENENYPTNNHKVLKKGDIVICDLDMLYLKDDPDYEEGIMSDVIKNYLKQKNNKNKEIEF